LPAPKAVFQSPVGEEEEECTTMKMTLMRRRSW